jgi:hypothetical protein
MQCGSQKIPTQLACIVSLDVIVGYRMHSDSSSKIIIIVI